jgi:hypothetical protein
MAGYSPRGLVEKLGIKEGRKVLFIQAPGDYGKTLGPLPEVASRSATAAQAASRALAKSAPFDFIQCFCREEAELRSLFPILKGLLAPDGMVWISWPKKTKGVPKDQTATKTAGTSKAAGAARSALPLGENHVREIGLAAGLVDVKVCAVDETWSGLKFMFRLRDRPAKTPRNGA